MNKLVPATHFCGCCKISSLDLPIFKIGVESCSFYFLFYVSYIKSYNSTVSDNPPSSALYNWQNLLLIGCTNNDLYACKKRRQGANFMLHWRPHQAVPCSTLEQSFINKKYFCMLGILLYSTMSFYQWDQKRMN